MTNKQHAPASSFTVSINKPLIGIPSQEKGHMIVRYFSDEVQAEHSVSQELRQEVRNLAGAWSDLPSVHMEETLNRVRHESRPTPPINV